MLEIQCSLIITIQSWKEMKCKGCPNDHMTFSIELKVGYGLRWRWKGCKNNWWFNLMQYIYRYIFIHIYHINSTCLKCLVGITISYISLKNMFVFIYVYVS